MTKLKGLPSAVFAEKLVLGGVLVTPARFAEIRETLAADDFSLDKHRRIWRRMEALSDSGRPIDRVVLCQALADAGELESVDGMSYIASLDEHLPEIHALDEYAATVKRKSQLRQIITAANGVMQRAMADTDAPEAVLEYADEAFGFVAARGQRRSFETPEQVIASAGGINGYLSARRAPGVDTPWPRLNRTLVDLQPGDLCILAADTGVGKTTMALNWAIHAAQKHIGVAVYSLEMSRCQITDKLIANLGEINSYVLRREPNEQQRGRIMAGATLASELPIYMCDSAGLDVTGLKSGVARLRAARPIGFVIVDYLQLMEGRGRSHVEQVASVARGLKNAAMALGVPILALSQFSRATKGDNERAISDLKDSSEIEQAANQILLLTGKFSFESEPSEWLAVTVEIGKNRGGDAHLRIPMQFRRDIGVIRE